LITPLSIASIIRSIDIILVILAGAKRSLGFFENIISPVEASNNIADVDVPAKGTSSAFTILKGNTNVMIRRKERIFFITHLY
jgi:hypothetical protein